MNIEDAQTLCWLGGLFEGEAYFSTSDKAYPQIRLIMADEEIVGRVAGLFNHKHTLFDPKRERWSKNYVFTLKGKPAAILMRQLYPIMGERRRERIDRVLENYAFPKPNHVFAKLTEEQVRAIKKRLATGEIAKSIATDFDITHYNVWAIREGKSWKHISAGHDSEQSIGELPELLSPDVPVASFDTEENRLYWTAGLLEAEGSFMKGSPSALNSPRVSVPMTDEDVIARLAGFLGVSYQSLRVRQENHKQVFRVYIKGKRAVELMKQLYPLMGKRRQSQIQKALDSYTEFSQIGERSSSAKISEKQAREIKHRALAGEAMKIIAEDFGVSVSIVREIKYGRTWKHI